MEIKEIGVTLGRSIKVDEYQYYKPELFMLATITEGESADDLLAQLKDKVRTELEQIITEEKFIYHVYKKSTQLKAIIRTKPEGSPAYKKAVNDLQKLEDTLKQMTKEKK